MMRVVCWTIFIWAGKAIRQQNGCNKKTCGCAAERILTSRCYKGRIIEDAGVCGERQCTEALISYFRDARATEITAKLQMLTERKT